VIVFTTLNGHPLRYYRYCQQNGWRWTKQPHLAQVFRSYDQANSTALLSSLAWQSDYQIHKIE
jgi:hypothetical protein